MSLTYNKNLLDIDVYKPGQSSLAGFDTVIKLSSNENPYGTSPKALAAYKDCTDKLFKYPDGSANDLTQTIAAHYNIDETRIVCGAGSDNIIELDIDQIIKAINNKTKIIFLPTPDNPTGQYIPQEKMQKLIDALPSHCLLVIDEAYGEYVDAPDYKSGLAFADAYPNIAVTRTFSKLFALAALRVGWGYLPPIAAEALNKIRSPFNVSMPAQQAAIAILKDQEWITDNIVKNNQQRQKMVDYYQLTGCRFIPSQANFICLIRHDAEKLNQFLRSKGIIVRMMAGNGTPELVRISIGSDAENKQLQVALSEYFTNIAP